MILENLFSFFEPTFLYNGSSKYLSYQLVGLLCGSKDVNCNVFHKCQGLKSFDCVLEFQVAWDPRYLMKSPVI